ncbi:cytochrome P450 [Saccharothrix violaceirubra]|uniref:Cytochrome P450 n=1 Tax=Saccharothrix violaceirubra TaxID=413306 RepID=A0A7W7T2Q4_9PSEU|nr:cytochrome P450 [Saccharothrix violaceirubra]MBB4964902.1 cytochrome P450 [Saccharothrix violaceirubra]
MSDLKNAALLLLGRLIVRFEALRGDPGARLFGTAVSRDPYPVYEAVRAKGELVHSSMRLFMTSSHALCDRILRDPVFEAVPAGALSPVDVAEWREGRRLVNPVDESFLVLSPPDHTRLRRMVAPWFTPRGLRARAEFVDRVVDEYLDRVDGPFDLVGDFAARVPVRVIADLLGVPDDDHDAFDRWGAAMVVALDGAQDMKELRTLRDGLAEFEAFLDDLIARRRREPGEDVVSALVGRGDVDRRDLIATTELLLVAGFETTVNLIGNAVLAVVAHPEVRERLVAEPSFADAVVEETLRMDPPVQYTVRAPNTTVRLAGTTVPKGTPIALLLAGANRDPAVFADPHTFRPDRPEREHLAFSGGIHYCLGAGLARMEAAAALRGLFGRFPDLRVAGRVRRRQSRVLRGAARLPVAGGRHTMVETIS